MLTSYLLSAAFFCASVISEPLALAETPLNLTLEAFAKGQTQISQVQTQVAALCKEKNSAAIIQALTDVSSTIKEVSSDTGNLVKLAKASAKENEQKLLQCLSKFLLKLDVILTTIAANQDMLSGTKVQITAFFNQPLDKIIADFMSAQLNVAGIFYQYKAQLHFSVWEKFGLTFQKRIVN
ncbi:hypothetical protein O181_006524 [Austropuccinia psidii MF-1]|uniref:Uncharacterized protein n=1 Tax=Austropuccinia psidii MF-1 TaxID=1389203 RepID=A0A9Q3GGZ0_9BASI|nr:hypothetical protein [Austropuccinia psidii MF-1]